MKLRTMKDCKPQVSDRPRRKSYLQIILAVQLFGVPRNSIDIIKP